jgi:putative ABC transport system substrate-binding protein
MRRRDFIPGLGGAAVAWPLAVRAQAGRIGRLGCMLTAEDHPYTKATMLSFRRRLSDLGWVEGRNLRIDYRWYREDRDRYTRDAAELVALAPDVILASGGVAVLRLLGATRTVPIVFVHVNEPVARGFVASLRQPGGDATGFTHLEYQMSSKWLELLKQIAPHVTRVAVMGGYATIDGTSQLGAIQAVASSLGGR